MIQGSIRNQESRIKNQESCQAWEGFDVLEHASRIDSADRHAGVRAGYVRTGDAGRSGRTARVREADRLGRRVHGSAGQTGNGGISGTELLLPSRGSLRR